MDEMTKRSYARCKACDNKFYPAWRERRKEFESLCNKCLPISIHTAKTDEVLYPDVPDVNTNAVYEDSDFLTGYAIDKQYDTGDLYQLDEYLADPDSMGSLNLFDKYGE